MLTHLHQIEEPHIILLIPDAVITHKFTLPILQKNIQPEKKHRLYFCHLCGASEPIQFELDFYRILCDSNNIDISSHAVMYSKTCEIKHIKFNGFDTINKMISDTKDAIDNNNFEPKKNQWCYNCEFRDLCKFGAD